MRSLTGQENAVLQAPDGHSAQARVWLWNGTAFEDVTALEGRDWLVEVSWDESVDDACAQATVTLRRQLEDYSLNPLVANKLTGVLALGRPFYIEAATLPLGDAATSGDWREVFRGVVETLALDKDPLTFTGRDGGGALVRNFIETDREYGSDAGVAVETVLQSILTDNSTGVTLYVPVATGAVFGKFKQKKAAVMTAGRELALRIGWDVRYRWDSGTASSRFTLIKPDRLGAVGSVWTFQPSKVKRVTRLEQTVHDVRNAGRLYYYDRATLDTADKATLSSVTASDATSITAYGRGYMQLAEDEDSPIDSAAEAQAMLDGAIADLKDPLLDFGVEVGFFYAAQLGDIFTFAADDVHFSSAQALAVVGIAHNIGVKGHRTSLKLRGKPVGANALWLRREGRVRQQPPAIAPEAVSSLTATGTAGGGTITFGVSTVPPLPVEFELHTSTSSGFTATSATLRALGSTTSFEVAGLSPGVTYYARVVSRDAVGNRAVSSAVSFTPLYVEARSFAPRASFAGSLILNSDFEERSDAAAPPDRWTTTAGTWGTDVLVTSDALSGGNAIRFTSAALVENEGAITSDAVAVRPGLRYSVDTYGKGGTMGQFVYTTIEWLDSSFSYISENGTATGATASWARYGTTYAAPATARYARLRLHAEFNATGGTIDVDSVLFVLADTIQESTAIPTLINSWANYLSSSRGPVTYYKDNVGRVNVEGSLTGGATGSTAFVLPVGYRPLYTIDVRVYASGAAADIQITASGAVAIFYSGAPAYIGLAGVSFRQAN